MTLDVHRRRDRKRTIHVRVFLNNVELKDCFYADGRRGVARSYVRDPQGRHIIHGQTFEPLTEELRGKIKFVRIK